MGWKVNVTGGISVTVDYGWCAAHGAKLTSCALAKALANLGYQFVLRHLFLLK
jgi:hypothetical protein